MLWYCFPSWPWQIGKLVDLSACSGLVAGLFEAITRPTEDVAQAASVCLGHFDTILPLLLVTITGSVSVTNVEYFLPQVISQLRLPNARVYMLVSALKVREALLLTSVSS